MKYFLLVVALACIALFDSVSSFRIASKPMGFLGRSRQKIPTKIIQPRISTELHAIIPGSPMVVGTIAQGLANSVSFFSNVILAR
jgi:hypothetical protein